MNLSLGYTRIDWNLASWAIRHSTKGDFSHVLLILTLSQAELLALKDKIPPALYGLILEHPAGYAGSDPFYEVYFESIWKKDPVSGKDGVRGPYPLFHLREWVEEDPKKHHFVRQEIQDWEYLVDAHAIMEECLEDVSKIHYAPMQIVRNWLELRLNLGMPLRERKEGKDQSWTCSEFVARKLRHYALLHLRLGDFLFNEYTPSGTRGPGLHELIKTPNAPVFCGGPLERNS